MKLIVGLGNPGTKYAKTRHNFGFLALDYVQTNLSGFEGWTLDASANALLARGRISGHDVLLAKPQTFMNLSGSAVQKLRDFYKIEVKNIYIIHDDYDLPLGILRISQGASAGGHKGVASIIEALGTKDFFRFRLGIHPTSQTFVGKIFNKLSSIKQFVLKSFSKEELSTVAQTIQKTSLAIETTLKEGVQQAMNEFN